MTLNAIDGNNRLNPLFEGMSITNEPLSQRIIDIALPFLSLYGPLSIAVNTVQGSIKAWEHLSSVPQHLNSSRRLSQELFHGSIAAASVFLTLFTPAVGIIFSQCVQIITDIYNLALQIGLTEYTEAAWTLLHLLQNLLYTSSIFFAAPEIILISMLSQICIELYQSFDLLMLKEYDKSIAKLVMAIIRICLTVPKAIDLHRIHFGHSVTLEEFLQVIGEARDTNKTVNEIFKAKHYSSLIKEINLNKYSISEITFDHMMFKKCNFDGSVVKDCVFSDVTFTECSLINFRAIRSIFQNSIFQKCSMKNGAFFSSNLSNVKYLSCNLSRNCFNESSLKDVHYEFCKMQETCFLDAKIDNASIFFSDLTDCLLLENKKNFKIRGGKPHKMTRPVISLSWNFESPQRMAWQINEALKEQNLIPLRNDYIPTDINPLLVDKEVLNTLSDTKGGFISIPKEILERATKNSEIAKIRKKASNICKHIHGMILPGGLDIEPELYNQERDPSTITRNDYRNSIFDFAMCDEATKKEIPSMGICRGSQVFNIYFGGSLKQDLSEHLDVFHHLNIKSDAPKHLQETMLEIVGDGIRGYSHHHQACDKIGQGLHVVLEADGSPEAMMNDDGSLMLLQFHPEFYHLYKKNPQDYPFLEGSIENNENFYKRFVRLSEERRKLAHA